ncbi:MAG TPA: LOG family protein [Pyrinomonadaceae bacterium]|nr:LOG family protein [Chloracidobacterium sp.]MBP9936688.1 LOG family protein [Pyrinomonadaceae bacterium]MBK7803905.1 LOG family protein [Chloracidobacterium sp.]MBK9439424.1 LOG family protein [Chloracidobacterium sp.]MBL0239289.1 LOG family protein [Chloracidobacterium sp.]
MNSTNDKIITIFGGSKCTEDSHEYQEAMALGSKLADAGYTICTGGYLGIMEAASRGAREKGGRVLGIVMNQFKSEPNRFLTDKVATDHFYDRLQNLILRSSGFVAFRGGMGTVTEVSLVWNKLQTRILGSRPLVLIGDCWPPVVKAWQTSLVVSDADVGILNFADDAEQAFKIIDTKSNGVLL